MSAGMVGQADTGAISRTANHPFRVRLARSGLMLEVPAEESILQVLEAHGCDLPSSCRSGTCGTCMVGLVAGEAEHRDFVLEEDERDAFIMICVSRAVGDLLVLDL